MNILIAAKLSDYKLKTFLAPMAEVDFVDRIYLVRRNPLDHKKTDLGYLGKFFGSPKNASLNIAGLVIIALLLLIGFVYLKTGYIDENKELYAALTSLITLSLGYLFGVRGKDS